MQGFSKCWSIPWTPEGESSSRTCDLSRCGGNSSISGVWGAPSPPSRAQHPQVCHGGWKVDGHNCHNHLLTGIPPQAYVNMALFENFTYAGIDATAEEA